MTALCAATNTTLDDYYDWDIPALKEEFLQQKLSSVNGPYSFEVYNFIARSLDYNEETRASLDDHEKFLRKYQKEATEVRLDFRRKVTVVEKVVVKPRVSNKGITGEDFFFDVKPEEPAQRASLLLPSDDFFKKKVTVIEKVDGSIVKK